MHLSVGELVRGRADVLRHGDALDVRHVVAHRDGDNAAVHALFKLTSTEEELASFPCAELQLFLDPVHGSAPCFVTSSEQVVDVHAQDAMDVASLLPCWSLKAVHVRDDSSRELADTVTEVLRQLLWC